MTGLVPSGIDSPDRSGPGGLERFHAMGASNAFHHTCEETGEATFAVPDTNGRIRCCECGAFQRTSGGETHAEPFPLPVWERGEGETDRVADVEPGGEPDG